MSQQPAHEGLPQNIPLQALPLEQLDKLRQNTERELDYLNQTLATLSTASRRFSASKSTALDLQAGVDAAASAAASSAAAPPPPPTLVPITPSMYVPGRMVDPGTLTVDLGTGYYAEMNPKQAAGYFERKVEAVRVQMEIAQGNATQKRQQLEA
eukprot:CAMPEP_0184723210 /NCGR_PEP_ID=MMETSP0314-20130426/24495_1 /TAXON_ID=38298 /ORGANISM="Rhodella maculata, Strain CCMP 736" /LENGTH=153 /DNA_ID=CAMNT_0027187971 /DNA_START=14 /DNA_END=472 /DNA_ORIENTATION=+